MNEEIVAFESVAFSYEKNMIFHDCSFQINHGEFICIIGPSGCGKTTLFRLLAGLENEDAGQIRIHQKIAGNRLGMIGYLPQHDALMPWRTVLENVCIPMEIQKISKDKRMEVAANILQAFQLTPYANHYPHHLSGGMRQRVAFARTVLTNREILVLDEPFSALDAITKLSMQEWLLDKWAEMNHTIVFITHDVEEAIFLADRIFILHGKQNKLLEEVTVPLQRPRTMEQMVQPSIGRLKATLLKKLRGDGEL